MCTIKDQLAKTIATISNSNRLYKIAATKQAKKGQSANMVTRKMSISEAHRKFRHISCSAIEHTIIKAFITGITLDLNSKPEFCEPCTKAKSAQQHFPQESCQGTPIFSFPSATFHFTSLYYFSKMSTIISEYL